MGLWGGIKYAVNSTLGTAQFKPLDRQIAELKTDVAALQSRGAMKGIQRVNFNGTSTDAAIKEYNIAISAVNTAKTVIRTSWEFKAQYAGNTSAWYKMNFASATAVRIQMYNLVLFETVLEIIEFY